MKKLFLLAMCWPIFDFYSPVYAQKIKTDKNKSREIIIMRNSDKDTKLTIETKNGEVFINGKPSSEYKDDNISIITGKDGHNFVFAPGKRMNIFNDWDGEKKSFLGVTTEEADNGVKVTDVSKGSAAEKAGLKEGDIITKVGSKSVKDPDGLMDAVTSYKPKEEVTVYFNRNGKSESVKATLGERSNMMRAFSFSDSNLPNAGTFNDFQFKMPKTLAFPTEPFKMRWGLGHGRLGVRIEDADNDAGAKITNVEDESAAEKAGLKKDDVITEVDGKKVKDVNEVIKELAELKDKTSYNVKAKRNGADMNFEIKIPKRKNNADL